MFLFTPESQGRRFVSIAGVMLTVALLFCTTAIYAQPTCEIIAANGQVTSCAGRQIVYTSNISTGTGTIYTWDFTTNTSGASIISGQGTSSVEVNTGSSNGEYVLRLTAVNSAGVSVCESAFTVADLAIQPAFTPINCFGSTSTLTVTSNGTGVTYTLLPMNISNTTGVFTGLTAGNYSVSATDISGCSASAVIVIPQPGSLIQATSSSQDNPCFGDGTGSIDLSVLGGVPPYSYSWSAANGGMIPPGQMNNQDMVQLFAGSYTVTITDAAGCTIQHEAIVSQPQQLTAQTSTTHVICWGAATGAIDLTITGGTPPYSYQWSGSWGGIVPSGMEGNQDLTGLTPGFYEVLVRDANNCSVSKSVALNGPSIGLATSYSQTNVGCAAGATGAIDLNVSNGYPPYSYSWVASNGGIVPPGQENLQDISGLVTGTYTCTVTDSINCTTTRTINIIQTNTGNIPVSANLTHPSCFNGSTGAIDITVNASTAGITYNWTASQGGIIPAGQANQQDLAGLVAGTYTVNINQNACSSTQTYVITQPGQLSVSYTSNPPVCYGGATGNIDATVAGGVTPFNYTWTGQNGGIVPAGQETQQDLAGLNAGTYSLTVTDVNGCSVTGPSVTLNEPAEIQANLAVTNIVVCNTASGAIDITVTGGSGSFAYEWSASAGGIVPVGQVHNEDITGLIPGTYHVNITDGNNCDASFTAIVSDNCGGPLPCSITVSSSTQNVSCYGENDGKIELNITGSAPFTIVWTATNGGTIPAAQQGNALLTDLAMGTYSYDISSVDGCTESGSIQISGPSAPLTITETHTNVACGNSSGSIDITVSGGTALYSYEWTVLSTGSIPTGQALNEDLTGLAEGTYNVRVVDANGCIKEHTITITNNTADINIVAQVTQPACDASSNGAIDITPSGGTGSYSYQWSATEGGIVPAGQQNLQDLTGLIPGKYEVLVTDGNGCNTTQAFILNNTFTLQVSVQKHDVDGCGESNGSINISHTSAGGPYTYTWTASNGGVVPSNQVNHQDLNNIQAGTYSVTISNAAGCEVVKEVVVTENCVPPSYGCGHGYWKNHPEHWNQISDPVVANMPSGLRFTTTTNFLNYFSISTGVSGLSSDLTMAEVLQLNGNGCRGFARSAVKALLVIASGQNVVYPTGTTNFTQVYNAIRNALINNNCNGTLKNQLNSICNGNVDDDDGRPDLITGVTEIVAYPNPFVSEIRFQLNPDIKGNVSLELYSLTGEKLAIVFQGPLNGRQSITYRVPEKHRRSMIYVLRSGSSLSTGKLIYLN